MIDFVELEELFQDIRGSNFDHELLLQTLIFLELKKLNHNLSQIDFSLRGLVYK